MIKLLMIGRLGKDCTTNNVNGNNVINFSVVHSEKYKDSMGNMKEKSTWAECAYWTEKTGIVPYLNKGTQVYVEGYPDVRSYTTNDGKQGSSLVVRVISVQLLGSKSDNQASSGGNNNYNNANNNSTPPNDNNTSNSGGGAEIDDLPF